MSTLYDLLQVTPQATPETIRIAYTRLMAGIRDDSPDAEIRRQALNEAFATLYSPELRDRYDQRLNISRNALITVYPEAEIPTPPRSRRLSFVVGWILVAIVIAGYLTYNRMAAKAQHEQRMRRIVAEEARQMDPRTEDEKLADKLRLAEEQRQREAERIEREQRQAQDQAQYEADRNMRQRQAAEENDRRESEMQKREYERQQQMAQENEYREAQRRLEREKATARQMEYENSRNR